MIEHHVNGIELLTEDRGNAPIYLSAFLFDNVYVYQQHYDNIPYVKSDTISM